jgi:hypothetical protein
VIGSIIWLGHSSLNTMVVKQKATIADLGDISVPALQRVRAWSSSGFTTALPDPLRGIGPRQTVVQQNGAALRPPVLALAPDGELVAPIGAVVTTIGAASQLR